MQIMAKGLARWQRPRVLRRPRPFLAGLGLAAALLLVPADAIWAWGPTAHRLVNNWAIQTLPPEIRGFFEANRSFIVEHADDPDEWMQKNRYERKNHYIYLDKYGMFPFLALPHSFQRAEQEYGAGHINRDGVLPWQIGKFSERLTNALKAHNWDEAKLDAAALAHYVADAHDPLNVTQNYDGQLTGQTGLAERFGTRLIDRFSNFFLFRSENAVKIDDPTEYAFQACIESHIWVESLLWADLRTREGLVDYTDEYYDRFYTQVGPTVVRGLTGAAHDAGSYWYTAWLNAGKPALPPR
jgi:hypothetical protein